MSDIFPGLVEKITEVVRKIVCELNDTGESFYYYCLITTGEGHCPVLSAWSLESLEREASQAGNYELAKYDLKWSAADSPYYAIRQDLWGDVDSTLSSESSPQRVLSEEEWTELMNAMVETMETLDKELVFGNRNIESVFINCEVLPPDEGNDDRARFLNPDGIYEWYVREQEEEMPGE